MAFLDNSGDIILDAVLTDTGRLRLARGDGSFRIAKFVFADDEINYGLYDKNNASGSAYYDLDILQTPIFEAFTNNTSVVKHPLLSISRTNLLYLPVMKLNTSSSTTGDGTSSGNNKIVGSAVYSGTGTYLITVDSTTFGEGIQVASDGLFEGELLTTNNKYIRIDQGIDSNIGSPAQPIDSFLNETQYIVEIDNRLGSIVSPAQTKVQSPSFIDDDGIASYYFTLADSEFVEQIKTNPNDLQSGQVIAGPRGTCIGFQIKSSQQLRDSTYLFTTLGSTINLNKIAGGGTLDFYYIDTNIVVKGVTTGTSITIPVKFIKSIV